MSLRLTPNDIPTIQTADYDLWKDTGLKPVQSQMNLIDSYGMLELNSMWEQDSIISICIKYKIR